MRDVRPFAPAGKTVCVVAAGTAPTGVQVLPDDTKMLEVQFRVHNGGNITIAYSFATTDTGASNAAVVPTTGTATNAIPLAAGAAEVITAPRDSYWSAVAAANANVYITPGVGL